MSKGDKDVSEMSIEQAREVIAHHAEQERIDTRERLRSQYCGRFFKFRNSYSGGTPRWWMYAQVVDVGEWGHLTGLTFQYDGVGEATMNHGASLSMIGGGTSNWEEITEDEFRKESDKFVRLIESILSSGGATPRETLRQ